jgi:hypothetical protein
MMASFDSVEIRWFGPLSSSLSKQLAVALDDLKARGNDVDHRPDAYLRVRGAADFGVKIRGKESDAKGRELPEKLEFKGRTHALGTQIVGNRLIGNVECWSKWSYEGDDALAILRPDERLVVEKTRLQVKFGYDDKFRLSRLQSAKERVSKGGAFEVTSLKVGEEQHWTIGIEAFPTDSETVSRFTEFADRLVAFMTTEHLVDVVPLESLIRSNSRSYPEWLARLT